MASVSFALAPNSRESYGNDYRMDASAGVGSPGLGSPTWAGNSQSTVMFQPQSPSRGSQSSNTYTNPNRNSYTDYNHQYSDGVTPDFHPGNRMGRMDRTQTEMSFYSVWDPDDEDPRTQWIRGVVFLSGLFVSMILLGIGLFLPLVHVVALPGSSMTTSIDKSLMDIIKSKTHNDSDGKSQLPACIAIGTACVIVPLFMITGTSIIITDNFFAKGCEWTGCLSAKTRNTIVSLMCTICSYEVVCSFLPIFVLSFLSTGATEIHLQAGFYCYCLFCLLSIGMLQAMETLKEPPEEDDMDRLQSMCSQASFKGGSGMRMRRVSSFFPALPGFERVVDVDSCQVFWLTLLFLVCSFASWSQPLLELHITLQGLTLERKLLSLQDCFDAVSTTQNNVVMYLVLLLVFYIPVAYCFLLLTAGVASMDCWKTCLREPPVRIYDGAVWLALLLKPWVMTDVFAIALGLFLFAMQDPKTGLVTTIPDGILAWPEYLPYPGGEAPPGVKLHFLNGVYLFVGAGVSVFFLRWFWAYEYDVADKDISAEMDADREEPYSGSRDRSRGQDGFEPLPLESRERNMGSSMTEKEISKQVAARSCCRLPFARCKIFWCILVWIVSCVIMHSIPLQLHQFRLSHTNSVLKGAVPVVNKLIATSLPATFGSCDTTDYVQLPCTEKGPIFTTQQGTKRISIVWISGLNTLSLTKLALTKHEIQEAEREEEAAGWGERELKEDDAEAMQAKLEAMEAKHKLQAMQARHAAQEAALRAAIAKAKSGNKGSDEGDDSKAPAPSHTTLPSSPAPAQSTHLPTAPPTTAVPVTAAPVTAAPVTAAPVTAAPVTAAPATAPATTLAPTPAPTTKPAGPQQYKVIVSGLFEQLHIFLRVEMCDDEKGNGCKPFLATNSSCCEPKRKFHIEITMRCNSQNIPSIHVSQFTLDSLVIHLSPNLMHKAVAATQKQALVVTLPSQDITSKVTGTVKSKLTGLLSKAELVKWGGKSLNFQELLGRVLKFSAHDASFQC